MNMLGRLPFLSPAGTRTPERDQIWVRRLIIAGVLILGIVLPLTTDPQRLVLLSGVYVAIGIAAFFLRWPIVGLIAAIVGGLVVPYRGQSGLNVTFVLIGVLLALWVLDMFVLRRSVRLVPSRTTPPLLAAMAVSVLAFGVGQLPWFPFAQAAPLAAQIAGLAIFVLSAGAFLLAANQIGDIRWLKILTWSFLGMAALYIAGRSIPVLSTFAQDIAQRGATDSLFWTWLVALTFAQLVFNQKLRRKPRLALAALLVLTFYVAMVQSLKWKSGWIPPLAAAFVIIWLRSWRVGLVLTAVGIVPALMVAPEVFASESYSYSTRLDAWWIMADMIKESPFFGLGFANYRWYTPLFRIRGYAVFFSSHNNYIDIIAQTGLVGLVCFLWFFWEVGRLGWRLRDRVPAGFARAYVYGSLGGLAGTLLAGMLGDWVLPFFYNIGVKGFRSSVLAWIFLGGLVALKHMYDNDESSQTTTVRKPQ